MLPSGQNQPFCHATVGNTSDFLKHIALPTSRSESNVYWLVLHSGGLTQRLTLRTMPTCLPSENLLKHSKNLLPTLIVSPFKLIVWKRGARCCSSNTVSGEEAASLPFPRGIHRLLLVKSNFAHARLVEEAVPSSGRC
eukprot:6173087-Pleurochrysis_carterae.AAC.1